MPVVPRIGPIANPMRGFPSSEESLKAFRLFENEDAAKITFYASPTGNDANDGLTALTPKTLQAYQKELLNYSPTLAGDVRINLAAGSYLPFTTPSALRSRQRIEIAGPDVAGGTPTAVIDATNSPYALRVDIGGYAVVSDIKSINSSTAGGGAVATGFLAESDSDAWFKNCHPQGSGGYAGLTGTENARVYVSGGRYDLGTWTYNMRFYAGTVFTVGYPGTAPSDGCAIGGGSVAGILAQGGAYGDVFQSTFTGSSQFCSLLTTFSRARFSNCSFSGWTLAGHKVQEGSDCDVLDGTNTFGAGTGPWVLRTGFGTELTLDANSFPERFDKRDLTPVVVSGTVTPTNAKLGVFVVPAEPQCIGMRLRTTVRGVMAGAGTKTVSVNLLSTTYLTFVSSAAYAGTYEIVVDIFFKGPSDQVIFGEYHEGGVVTTLRNTRGVAMTGAQSSRIQVTNSDAATGSTTVEIVESESSGN